HVACFRSSRASIRIYRNGMRKHALDLAIDRRRPVSPRHQRAVKIGRYRRCECREVSAKVRERTDTQRQELTLVAERKRRMRDMIPSMRVAHERFAAIGCPFDRPVYALRGPGH